MTDAPRISRGDVAQFLEGYASCGEERRGLIAVYGEGERDTVSGEAYGEFEIVPVLSELDLRELMPAYDESPKIVFVVPWSGELPLDISGRFSQNGRIQTIGPRLRLLRFFSASDLEPGLESTALARHLLQAGDGERYDVRGGRLTKDAMFEAFLENEVGFAAGSVGLDSLMAWAAYRSGGPELAEALPLEAELELMDYLAASVDPYARAVWEAWVDGDRRKLLELAVIFEGLTDFENPAVRMWTEMSIWGPSDGRRRPRIGRLRRRSWGASSRRDSLV